MKKTVWRKIRCDGGAQWTVPHIHIPHLCVFSGCGCETMTQCVGETTDFQEAVAWFKRPEKPIFQPRALNELSLKDFLVIRSNVLLNIDKRYTLEQVRIETQRRGH